MDHLLTIETHIEGDQQEVLHNVERHCKGIFDIIRRYWWGFESD